MDKLCIRKFLVRFKEGGTHEYGRGIVKGACKIIRSVDGDGEGSVVDDVVLVVASNSNYGLRTSQFAKIIDQVVRGCVW